MTPAQLHSWRKRLGLSQAEAGVLLGLSTRAILYYEKGERRIPKTVALACAAIALGVTEYPNPTATA